MSKTRFWAVLALAALFNATASAQSGLQPATPEMFGSLPNVAEAEISPSGRFLALLENDAEGASVVIYDLNEKSARPVGVRAGAAKARQLEWVDDDNLLLLASMTDKLNLSTGKRMFEFWRWVAIARTKKSARILMPSEGGYYMTGAGRLLATLPGEPGVALFYATRGEGTGLFAVNLETGGERLRVKDTDSAFDATFTTLDWIVKADGVPVARIDYNTSKKEVRILHTKDGGKDFDLVTKYPVKELEPWPLALSAMIDNSGVVAAEATGRGDTTAAVEFNLATGAIGETLFQHSRYDIDGFGYDPQTARSVYVQYTDDMPQRLYFDPTVAALQKSLKSVMPGATPLIESRSTDGGRTVIRAVYSDRPAEYFLYTAANGRLAKIAPSYRALDGRVYARREKFDYQSSDGMLIPGYLTVPAGRERKNLPLIALPHGGPGARDDMSFDWWAGFYAARGYLVYQPNFRGSTGYGRKFYDAGAGQWGRKMQDDISEGVKKLIADGVADGSRVCIVGASYGGYATLAGMTLTPELYACGVSVAGVSDLPAMLASENREGGGTEKFWESRMGATRFKNTDELNAVSPAKQVKAARAPILLIHGKDDTVVPFSQSVKMRDALNGAKKEVEFVALEGEDHWLSVAPTRIKMLEASISFIDKHIGENAR